MAAKHAAPQRLRWRPPRPRSAGRRSTNADATANSEATRQADRDGDLEARVLAREQDARRCRARAGRGTRPSPGRRARSAARARRRAGWAASPAAKASTNSARADRQEERRSGRGGWSSSGRAAGAAAARRGRRAAAAGRSATRPGSGRAPPPRAGSWVWRCVPATRASLWCRPSWREPTPARRACQPVLYKAVVTGPERSRSRS